MKQKKKSLYGHNNCCLQTQSRSPVNLLFHLNTMISVIKEICFCKHERTNILIVFLGKQKAFCMPLQLLTYTYNRLNSPFNEVNFCFESSRLLQALMFAAFKTKTNQISFARCCIATRIQKYSNDSFSFYLAFMLRILFRIM